MPIYASAGGDFKPAPAGAHAAICVDVIDLGVILTEYAGLKKPQHKVRIVWQIDEERDDGKLFTVSRPYTLSLHQKATLRRDLESWRGKSFTEDELKRFDLESLIGVPAMLNVIHAFKEGKTFANVAGVMKLMKGLSAPVPRDYVRKAERAAPTPQPAQEPAGGAAWDGGDYEEPSFDEEVPF
jgi:hypothetical protein